MLNVVCVMGRLAADPEIRQTQGGTKVARFSLACDRAFKDKNGERQTDWLDCSAFGKTAEFVEKFFFKGSLLALDGRIQTRSYQDKHGNNRKAVEIVAENVHFAESKKKDDSHRPGKPEKAQADDFEVIGDDEDLPF